MTWAGQPTTDEERALLGLLRAALEALKASDQERYRQVARLFLSDPKEICSMPEECVELARSFATRLLLEMNEYEFITADNSEL